MSTVLDASPMDHYPLVDWNRDGDYSDTTEDVAVDVLAASSGEGVTTSWGRDQPRAFSPPIVPDAAYTLNNEEGTYTNLYTGSPIYGYVERGAPAVFEMVHGYDVLFNDTDTDFNDRHVLFNGTHRPRLFTGSLWDLTESGEMGAYVAGCKFLSTNGLLLTEQNVTTQQVYTNLRTDQILTIILDDIGWPSDKRIIGTGQTIILYWWAEDKNALQACVEMLVSEGASAVMYIDPYGNFVFRPRDWRDSNPRSMVSQAIFADTIYGTDPTFGDTSIPMNDIGTLFNGVPDVSLYYVGEPQVRGNPDDIVNDASASINTRSLSALAPIWTWGNTVTLGVSQSADFFPSASDPFLNAIVPVSGTDFVVASGSITGVVLQSLTGQQAKLTLTAGAGGATVTGLQLRAQLLQVIGQTSIPTTLSTSLLTDSRQRHGHRAYTVPIWPEINPNVAQDIVNGLVLRYLRIRPQFQIAVVAVDRDHQNAMFSLGVDDRITIINRRRAIATDVFIERVEHRALSRTVHMTIFGCEQVYQSTVGKWDALTTTWDGSLARWGY
jgi:hypothetical protein